MKATYADAATRGRMRAWKEQLAELFAPLEFAPVSETVRGVAADYIRKGTAKGQRRALKKLQTMFGKGAVLQAHRLREAGNPYALWRYIAPKGTMFPETQDKQLLQDCVAVGYICVTGKGVTRNGLWGLIVPDHALGRAIHRSDEISPQKIVETAHSNLLRLRVGAVLPTGKVDAEHRFNLGSDGGCFISHLDYTPDVSARPWVFAHTWVSNSMVAEQQIVLTEDGLPGEQLGDQWLLPKQLLDINAKPHQREFGGKLRPLDMRGRKFTPEQAMHLVEELARCDVVWCDYGDDHGGQYLKGEERVHGHEDDDSTDIAVAWLRVANTTTIELLTAALDLHDKGEVSKESLALSLTVAGTVPGGLHDDKLFDAAMQRAMGMLIGNA